MEESKKPRRRRLLKVPTVEDFESYRGGHTFKKWQAQPKDWRCPGCERSRFELLTWTRSITGYGAPRGQYQWLAPLHEHHDHRVDGYVLPPRFPSTVICSDCNHADGRAKRQLGLPSWFSFSPAELRQFLTGHPHNGVVIDLKKALEIHAMVAPFLVPPPATPRVW
jgi:hypothetical protein